VCYIFSFSLHVFSLVFLYSRVIGLLVIVSALYNKNDIIVIIIIIRCTIVVEKTA